MLQKIIWSSVDSSKVSATVSGIIMMLSSGIVLLASHLGLNIVNDQVTAAATDFGALAGTVWTVFGIIRKIVVAFTPKIV